MQLKKLWIDGYKNLQGIDINFDGDGVPIAIIGNNGTGKSNLIEALLHIFMGLYYGTPLDFHFSISYEAHGKHVEINNDDQNDKYLIKVDGHDWTITRFKKHAREPELLPPFPATIFGYYSGTSERLEKQFRRYERTYAAKMKLHSTDLERNFSFSDIDQARFMLLALLGHGHFTFLNEISIAGLESVKFTLQPPERFDPEKDDPKFWGTQGAYLDFLADLDNLSSRSLGIGDNVYIEGQLQKRKRNYVLNQQGLLELGRISKKRGATIYSMLQALAARRMLVNVEYTIRHSSEDLVFDFNELSEGEKQLISVVGGLYLSQQNECLVLLDEPDTHLNPSWSWKYNSLVREALNNDQHASSTVLIATHDPVLISGLLKEQVLIAHQQDGVLTYDQPIRDPRGQGIANILTSEFFGLPSSLDKYTQGLLDERLKLAYKEGKLSDIERARLKEINSHLDGLGLSISFRDPDYKAFEEAKYKHRAG